ncbi:hypothetical protein [Methylobacterium sp. V23]|uniref:hypothetical protein n=1 Tax=Methylobacterium sp. V23 TaxID=2044878 RepID=UPI000CDB4D1E|nr:hypothetical protein [Methylobacterium sp. V23]POR40402.1 hypothetical protein CRT23_24050 [Methylobacterium sp. V23]
MTFEEQAAELHRLEAVALSLGLSDTQYERILLDVTATLGAAGASPAEQLATIRVRILATAQTRTQPAMIGFDL